MIFVIRITIEIKFLCEGSLLIVRVSVFLIIICIILCSIQKEVYEFQLIQINNKTLQKLAENTITDSVYILTLVRAQFQVLYVLDCWYQIHCVRYPVSLVNSGARIFIGGVHNLRTG